ncbi:MAG TPA: hypothetical protein VE913_09150 [Longimicrobium sp.]|nr:hypothetical protein [Longimicrobium sp.]
MFTAMVLFSEPFRYPPLLSPASFLLFGISWIAQARGAKRWPTALTCAALATIAVGHLVF